ncbi:MAG: hypothetical protein AB8B57_08810 [Congregibacter sp.]
MASGDFFVGYLPTPRSLRIFYRVLLPLLIVAGGLLAYRFATQQQSAGEGQWNPAEFASMEGLLLADPYPVLHLADGQSVLLVRAGKASAMQHVEPFVDQHVRIRGVPIERGGWMMLEVYSADDVQKWSPEQLLLPPAAQSAQEVSYAGEIVDSKCFLGVMKPGSGKVHRACAAMCLTGGLPPMLVVSDPEGNKYGYMLLNAEGGSASRELVPDVAIPVTVSGTLEVRGDLTYLRMHPGGVTRL